MSDKLRLLLVDDDPDYREVIEAELSDHLDRYVIDSVETFDQGLRAVRNDQHDVYLVDYLLDLQHTGDALIDETIDRMRPVILLTGREDDDLGDRVIELGASDFIMKRQINGDLLDRMIRNALGRHQRLQNLIQTQQELTQLVRHDPLTGLVSRRVLRETVEELLRTNPAGGALLYIDLDGFKPINDQYGHATGDALLRQIAARLIDCVRPTDIVGRLGGDEFLVVLSNDGAATPLPEVAAIVAGKLVAGVAEPYLIDRAGTEGPLTLSTSASIGIALGPQHSADYDELIRLADQAMYRAKRTGKNSYAMHDE